MLSQALEKDTTFKVTMQIPPALLSPTLMVCSYLCCKCICVAMVYLVVYVHV